MSDEHKPVAGEIWVTEYPNVAARRVIGIAADPWSGVPVVRYVRGKEGGTRLCSFLAWRAWVADNAAKRLPMTPPANIPALPANTAPRADCEARRCGTTPNAAAAAGGAEIGGEHA